MSPATRTRSSSWLIGSAKASRSSQGEGGRRKVRASRAWPSAWSSRSTTWGPKRRVSWARGRPISRSIRVSPSRASCAAAASSSRRAATGRDVRGAAWAPGGQMNARGAFSEEPSSIEEEGRYRARAQAAPAVSATAARAGIPFAASLWSRSSAIACSPPHRWETPAMSINRPSRPSTATAGEKRTHQSHSASSASASAAGSASWVASSGTSAAASVAFCPANRPSARASAFRA